MIRKLLPPLILAFSLLLLSSFPARAQLNVAGGEISYKFLFKIDGESVYNRYRITVKLFKECFDPGSHDLSINLRVYQQTPNGIYLPLGPPLAGPITVPLSSVYTTSQMQNSCSPAQPLCYLVAVYSAEINLPLMMGDFIVYVQSDTRKVDQFKNVLTNGIGKESNGVMGYTYVCRIPGMYNVNYSAPSAPVVKNEYPLILCANQRFRYDFSAVDPDGDSLSYSFVAAKQGKIYVVPRFPTTADMPPFKPLIYRSSFTVSTPLGDSVQIDPVSGMISGKGPFFPGNYLVNVEVTKHRNGQIMGKLEKEVQFTFSTCTTPRAQLDSTYRNCNGTSVKFLNYSTGPIQTYFWDFGVASSSADTSNLAEPVFNYPGPGIYQVKLYLNKGTNLCKDSTFATAIVDTGMRASFTARRSIEVCNKAIFDFTNTSSQGANPITGYSWDFGEPSTTIDVSSLANPSYLYPTDGNKVVRLIVKNEIGCSDTAFKTIQAYKSLLQLANDTTICNLDTIAIATNTWGYPGTFNWLPDYNISSLTSPSPMVSPKKDTTYYARFTDTTGCITLDSIRIKVRDSVAISLNNIDTTICQLDTIFVSAIHDGLLVTWQPSASIVPVNPDQSMIKASPFSHTQLIATSHFGSCFAMDTMNIRVIPKPKVTVNNDTTVCFGAPVYLQAGGGSIYSWSPGTYLNNNSIPDPVARPWSTTIYTVTVRDTLGCPKPVTASVNITAFRGLIAIAEKDTMVVEGEPVQLHGAGGQYYQWSPAQYLSDPFIANPVSRPFGDITYVMKITNDNNCVDSAIVKVRGFKDPDIYVPTAFTPNRDGKNDLFKVFPVGFELKQLKIFDRWGNVVFVTRDYRQGWDGKMKGLELNTGTFIWVATGVNIKTGKPIMKKGTVALIH